jgi:hypothetical protein
MHEKFPSASLDGSVLDYMLMQIKSETIAQRFGYFLGCDDGQ